MTDCLECREGIKFIRTSKLDSFTVGKCYKEIEYVATYTDEDEEEENIKENLMFGLQIAGIVIGTLLSVIVLILCCAKRSSPNKDSVRTSFEMKSNTGFNHVEDRKSVV